MTLILPQSAGGSPHDRNAPPSLRLHRRARRACRARLFRRRRSSVEPSPRRSLGQSLERRALHSPTSHRLNDVSLLPIRMSATTHSAKPAKGEPALVLDVPAWAGSKESEMSSFPDEDMQQPYEYTSSASRDSAPMWVIGSIVVLLVLGMVWYGLSGPARVGPAPDQPAIQHTTQPPAPTAPPAEPSTTPKP